MITRTLGQDVSTHAVGRPTSTLVYRFTDWTLQHLSRSCLTSFVPVGLADCRMKKGLEVKMKDLDLSYWRERNLHYSTGKATKVEVDVLHPNQQPGSYWKFGIGPQNYHLWQSNPHRGDCHRERS